MTVVRAVKIGVKNIIDTFKGKRVLGSGSSSLKLKQGLEGLCITI